MGSELRILALIAIAGPSWVASAQDWPSATPDSSITGRSDTSVTSMPFAASDPPAELVPLASRQGPRLIILERLPALLTERVPEVGDPPQVIFDYLARLRDRIRVTKERIHATHKREHARELRDRLRAQERLLAAETRRLTENDGVLTAFGAALIAAGGTAVVASLGYLLAWGLSADDDLELTSLALAGGGAVGLGAGAPMLAFGLKRTPREPRFVAFADAPSTVAAPVVGLTLRWEL
jgi:hypothetical protein